MNRVAQVEVVPKEIVFSNISPGKTMTMNVSAHNMTGRPISIKFSLPANSPFRIPPNRGPITAPGLEVKTVVTYECKSSEVVKDFLKVETDHSTVNVPITAYPPTAELETSVNHISVGQMSVDTSCKRSFTITNVGASDARYEIQCSERTAKFDKSDGPLPHGSSRDITFTFRPVHPRQYNFGIDILLDGKLSKTISVDGVVADHPLALSYQGKNVDELAFGHVYCGQKKILEVQVMNMGTCKSSFVINPPRDSNSPVSLSASRKFETLDEDNVFYAIPCEGVLEPKGKTTLAMVFQPPPIKESDDVEVFYTFTSSIEVVENGRKSDFQLTGFAAKLRYELSQIDFDFEYQKVYTRGYKELVITNCSKYLPITFEMSKVAHFHFQPETGTIPPNGKKTIKVTFWPKNLGVFEKVCHISVCGGLSRRHINLFGTSLQKGSSPQPFRRKEIWEVDKTAEYNVTHPGSLGFSFEDIERTQTLRKTFDKYITDSAEKREKRAKTAILKKRVIKEVKTTLKKGPPVSPREMNGIIRDTFRERKMEEMLLPASTLKPPEPKLLKMNDVLVIDNPEKLGLISTTDNFNAASLLRKKNPVDDRVLVKKKFKRKPTTPPEINECQKVLSPTQQLLVSASHQTINFGLVSIFSTEIRSFTVTNNLEQNVFVELQVTAPEMQKTTPLSQVIPPLQTAGFDVAFSSNTHIKNFTSTMTYTINKVHEFPVNICAQVCPIELNLSKDVVDFAFPYDYTKLHIREYVSISNPTNSVAEYRWNGFSGQFFKVTYESGKIGPKETYNAEITYVPGTVAHAEETVELSVVGGPSKTLKLIGDVGKPKISMNKKRVDFGLIPVGVVRSQTVRIKNTGKDDAIFAIRKTLSNQFSVTPMNGRMSTGESILIQIKVRCDQPGPFQDTIYLDVAGANPQTIAVCGQGEVPNIELGGDELQYGQVFVGSSLAKQIIVKNTGQIAAVLYLNLTDHPAFRIEFNSELSIATPGEKTDSIVCVASVPKMRTLKKEEIESSDESEEPEQVMTTNQIHRITIVEGHEVAFNLVFKPARVGDYSFDIPLTMMYSTPAAIKVPPKVSAEAIHAPLILSTTCLHFGVGPIFSEFNPNNRAVVRDLKLTNDHSKSVKYRFGDTIDVFSMDFPEGEVSYSESLTLFISFKPKRPKLYSCSVPLYVETEEGERTLAHIFLSGVGSSRLFKTSVNYVCIPPVPVGMKIERTVTIVNWAFIDSKVDCALSFSDKAIPLTVSFPKGNQLRHSEAGIPLKLTFFATKPISFSTVIAITNETGLSYSFTVTATADNSVFTLLPYMLRNEYRLTGDSGKPITAIPAEEYPKEDMLSLFLGTDDILTTDKLKMDYDESVSGFIMKFLNTLVLNSQIGSFPAEIRDSDGDLLVEIMENVVGLKRAASFRKGKTLMDTLTSLIHFMMSQGASISNVRPEFLLPKGQFLQMARKHVTSKLLGLDYYGAPDTSTFNKTELTNFTSTQNFLDSLTPKLTALENVFERLSKQSYITLLLQIIKLFFFTTVDANKLNSTPGVSDKLTKLQAILPQETYDKMNRSNRNLAASNIYSATECMLLKWATIYYIYANPENPKFIISFAQLEDPEIFASLIRGHVQNIAIEFGPKKKHNYRILADAMRQLKMGLFPTPEELACGNEIVYAVILFQLFLILPRYVPIDTIEFKTFLNKPQIHSITISNPSRNDILYVSQVEGSDSFEPLVPDVVLAGGETMNYQIKFIANTHIPQKATLMLVPGKPRSVSSETPLNDEECGGTSRVSARSNQVVVPPLRNPSSPASKQNTPVQSKNNTPNASPRRGNQPLFVSPIVVDLVSHVACNSPLKSFEVTGPAYSISKVAIEVDYPFTRPGKFKLFTRTFKIANEHGEVIDKKATVQQQIQAFLDDPSEQIDEPDESLTQFESVVARHQSFLFDCIEAEFPTKSSVDVEFNPIALGTYRCLVLFRNEEVGEFIYEVIGKAELPEPIVVTRPAIKVEATKVLNAKIPIEVMNPELPKTLAYSYERMAAFTNYVSERKFRDLMTYRTREFTTMFYQSLTSYVLTASVSLPQFYSCPEEVYIFRNSTIENFSKDIANVIPLTFSPTRPGTYQNKVVLLSPYDIRVYSISGIAIPLTREIELVMETVAGREVYQDIPFTNTSQQVWQYKAIAVGDHGFRLNNRFTVDPESTGELRLSFYSKYIGEYKTDITITNITKESLVVYRVCAKVEEPPSEATVTVKCRAREKCTQKLDVPAIIREGVLDVTSTVPIMEFPPHVTFERGKANPEFEFSLMALRSGVSVGTLTFTDPTTGFYCWFVIDCKIEPPAAEETIHVTTQARKSITIDIPLTNNKSEDIDFDVAFSEADLFGEHSVVVPAKSTKTYQLVYSPLKDGKKISTISFYNDIEGEYIYKLDMVVEPPEVFVVKPLFCPIGKSVSAFVTIENPIDEETSLRVENSNQTCFQVKSNEFFHVGPREKKRIEITYIPSSIGTREEARVQFISPEIGVYAFELSGAGKPPQISSPTIIESDIGVTVSTTINFVNPFPYAGKFMLSLNAENPDAFRFLSKKRTFSLSTYGEIHQIAVLFTPPRAGHFKANVVISKDEIQWFYPVIGNGSILKSTDVPQVTGRNRENICQSVKLPLIGERENFDASEYSIDIEYESGYEFMQKTFDIRPTNVVYIDGTPNLQLTVKYEPKRPLSVPVGVSIENPIGQIWKFEVNIVVETGEPDQLITLECGLNKSVEHKIFVKEKIAQRTFFHAYFANGSSAEFRISKTEGILEPCLKDGFELPFSVTYEPLMYGKVMKALLVVDTLEVQWTFEFTGKVPDYVPPALEHGSGQIDFSTPESVKNWSEIRSTMKRNCVKENIEGAKITRPRTALGSKIGLMRRPGTATQRLEWPRT